MKITNKNNLPSVFQNFSELNGHSSEGADITVTSLIDSPQIFRLRKEHDEEITEDVSDHIYSILGTAVHKILEDGSEDNCIVEERLHAEFDGMTISGAIDLQTPIGSGFRLSDYKTCTAYTLVYNIEGKPEWERQLNCYDWLCRQNDKRIVELEDIAIVRDWSRASVGRRHYPETPVVRVPITPWDPDMQDEYVASRIEAHKNSEMGCSFAERWGKPERFAIHNDKSKSDRASKICDTHEEAVTWIGIRSGFRVESRPPTYTRCDNNYCSVSEFCSQYKFEKIMESK